MFSRSVTIALLCCATLAFGQERGKNSFGGDRAKAYARGASGSKIATSGARTTKSDTDGARFLIEKYDENKNRVLEESEWREISGSPERADYNGDKRLTYEELVKRLGQRRREKEAKERSDRSKADKEDGPRSLRLTTALDRLPDDLPSWFKQKDRNKDGQVAMHEYERRWNDSTVRRFAKYDRNDDGIITASEALAGGR